MDARKEYENQAVDDIEGATQTYVWFHTYVCVGVSIYLAGESTYSRLCKLVVSSTQLESTTGNEMCSHGGIRLE